MAPFRVMPRPYFGAAPLPANQNRPQPTAIAFSSISNSQLTNFSGYDAFSKSTSKSSARSASSASAIRFGFNAQDIQADPKHVLAYQKLFESMPNHYGHPYNVAQSIEHVNTLDLMVKGHLAEALEMIPPKLLKDLFKGHKLGVMEEGSGILWELFLYRAIQKGIITPDLIQKVHDDIIVPFQGPDFLKGEAPLKPFKEAIQAIYPLLSQDGIQKFQKITGDKDPHIAQQRLALGVFKYAILNGNNKADAQSIQSRTYDYLMSETAELAEQMGDSAKVRKALLKPYIKLFANNRILPTQYAYMLPRSIVRHVVEFRVPKDEMLNFEFLKQQFRQNLHYNVGGGERGQSSEQGGLSYDQRKALYKPIEWVLESWRLLHSGLKLPKATAEEQAKLYTLA